MATPLYVLLKTDSMCIATENKGVLQGGSTREQNKNSREQAGLLSLALQWIAASFIQTVSFSSSCLCGSVCVCACVRACVRACVCVCVCV